MTTPLPIDAFGAKVKAAHPGAYDDLPDAEVGQKTLAKFPQYSDMVVPQLPTPAQEGAAIIQPQPSLLSQARGNFNANTQGAKTGDGTVKSAVEDFGAGGGDVVRSVAHPIRTLKSMVNTPDMAMAGLAHLAGDDTALHTIEAEPHTSISRALGQVGTGAILGEAGAKLAAPISEAAASTLNTAGRGLKRAGALTSRVAIAAPSPVDNFGADAGQGLSQNRIVGATDRSLLRKVNATVEPASQARDAVLARSPVGPNVDLTQAVNQPFNDVTAVKVNPRTGATQPSNQARMVTTQRAINEVQNPQTGQPTGELKPLASLTPLEASQLGHNIYDMTDYGPSPDTAANSAIKGAAANVKDAILRAAPESSTATQNIHDVMGARDTLQARTAQLPSDPHSFTEVGIRAAKMAKRGIGTAVGAGLDVAGSAAMDLGGAIRRTFSGASPVGPTAPESEAQRLLPADVPANGETGGPREIGDGGPGFQRSATAIQTPPPAQPRGLLTQVAGPDAVAEGQPVGVMHPGEVGGGRVNRTQPQTPTLNQQVLEDQPGYVAPRGPRRLIADPGGNVRPEPYGLPSPPTPLQLEARTGGRAPSARPALLAKLRAETEADAAQQESAVNASRTRLAEAPEGSPDLNINPSKVEHGDRSSLSEQLFHGTSTGNVPKIREEGLKSSEGKVYMTPQPDWAKVHAIGTDGTREPGQGSVLRIDVPRKILLRRDENDDQGGLGSGSVYTTSNIPPTAISKVHPVNETHITQFAKPLTTKPLSQQLKELQEPAHGPQSSGDYTFPTLDAFSNAARQGKLIESTGKAVPGEDTVTSALELGKLNGYSPNDVAHFYAARRGAFRGQSPEYDADSLASAYQDLQADASKRLSLSDQLSPEAQHGPYQTGPDRVEQVNINNRDTQDRITQARARIATGKKPRAGSLASLLAAKDAADARAASGTPAPLRIPDSANSPATKSMDFVRQAPDRAAEAEADNGPKLVPSRLPAPNDIDGWEALVDEGKARYNTRTHSYEYTASPTRTLKSQVAKEPRP